MIGEALHKIGQSGEDTLVVQIGAMDGVSFDDVVGYFDMYTHWKALYVEPVPYLFERLRNNRPDTNIFENSAIVSTDGPVEMVTIDNYYIDNGELPAGFGGMSAVWPPKNGLGTEHDKPVLDKHGKKITVNGITLDTLFNKHNIENFDVFLCDAEGLDCEIFRQLDLNKYSPKIIRLEWMNLNDQEKEEVKEKLEAHGYNYEISGQDIDAVKNLDLNSKKIDNNLTLVTGLWDIGNETRGRDWERYEKYFDLLLKTPCNMVIFAPKSLEDFIWSRRSKQNTHVRTFELEDVKNLFSPFWDKWQSLRNSEEWQNITGEHGWLKDSPQLNHEYYNPIVMSKMFMLHDAKCFNIFDDDYLMWIDAGICQTVYENYLWDEKIIKSLTDYMKPFLFLSYPYNKNQDEVHGFKLEAMKKFAGGTNPEYVCRGGLFGGHRDFLSEANTEYYTLLNNTLSEGYAGTEESVFAILAHLHPENYRRYSLDENGLIVKFIQELEAGTAELDKVEMGNRQFRSVIRNISEVKTNLYFLTFNYPEQLEYTIMSLGNHKGFLDHPYQKVIIDNSTDEQARIDNKNICDKYGFEHIIRGENTGINGGRQFAAEHFNESDADFYLFFEDDMTLANPEEGHYCRNGLRKYIPDIYLKLHQVMLKEDFDFLKLSFTEVYMDNNIQTSWYNVPQEIRDRDWPEYNKLPTTGLDPYSPRTVFRNIERLEDGLCYINGEIYYSNWPMIVSREGNRKMFIETTWAHPFEQTWMSHMYQETKKGNLKPAVLLASPVTHERFKYYQPEERREN